MLKIFESSHVQLPFSLLYGLIQYLLDFHHPAIGSNITNEVNKPKEKKKQVYFLHFSSFVGIFFILKKESTKIDFNGARKLLIGS